MTRLEDARAMKCFGKLVENVERDPDPQTQVKLEKEYNCANCSSFGYCKELSDTLS